MAFISVRKTSSIKGSLNYMLKDEQTGHGLLIEENNCNQFNFETLLCLDEEKFRRIERNIAYQYKGEDKNYLDSIKEGTGLRDLKENNSIYAYTGYITFSSEDDISLSDARDIASETLKKTLGDDARFIVAAHTQGRNIHAHYICENGRSTGNKPRDFLFKNIVKEKLNEVCKERDLSSIYESMMYNRNRPKMTPVERMERKQRNPKENFYTLTDRVENSLKRSIYNCSSTNVEDVKDKMEKEGYEINQDNIYPQYRTTPVHLSKTKYKSWKKIKEILEETNRMNMKKLKEINEQYIKDSDFKMKGNMKKYFKDIIDKISAKDSFINKDNVKLANVNNLEDEVEFIRDAKEKEMELRLALNEDEEIDEELQKLYEEARETTKAISDINKSNDTQEKVHDIIRKARGAYSSDKEEKEESHEEVIYSPEYQKFQEQLKKDLEKAKIEREKTKREILGDLYDDLNR